MAAQCITDTEIARQKVHNAAVRQGGTHWHVPSLSYQQSDATPRFDVASFARVVIFSLLFIASLRARLTFDG